MDAVITVIIPVYNGEKYVARAVRSVIAQPKGEYAEVLIVNDGSRDTSGKICDDLAAEYSNVRVIHKENGGVSSARNLGIQNVRTKYVAFLDCDDWWEPDFLDDELLAEFTKEDSADVYQFAYKKMDKYCKLVKVYPVENQINQYQEPGLDRYDWSHPCCFVYRASLLEENQVEFPIAKVGEDGPFVEMALYHARLFRSVNRVIFTYWENMASCLHTTDMILDIKERYKSYKQERDYFLNYNVIQDPDTSLVWHIATNLPRICAENKYQTVVQFMDEYCLRILANRADIHFREELWSRFEAWRDNSRKYWLKNRILIGIPLQVKKICYRIPGISRITNYLYNRFWRGFVPIRK